MNKKYLQILISGLIVAGALGLLINRLCQMYLENTKAQIEKESIAQFRQRLVLDELRRVSEKVQALEFKIVAVEAKIPPREGTAEAARDKGFEYFKHGDYDTAISEFKKATQLDPQMSNAYENLGNAYYYKNDFDQAIENYNKTLELDPKNTTVYGFRMRAYFHKGEYEKAWQDVYKAEVGGYIPPSDFLNALKKASGREY